MSSGLVVATGSGSTALLKSMQDLSIDQVRNSLKILGVESNDLEIKKILSKINDDPEFDPQSRVLYFFHRELVEKLSKYPKRQGFAQSVVLKNTSRKAVLCIDSSEHPLNLDDMIEIRLCRPEENLHCLNLNIPHLL